MSDRTQCYCDLIIIQEDFRDQITGPGQQMAKVGWKEGQVCSNIAVGRCFWCGKDFCEAHKNRLYGPELMASYSGPHAESAYMKTIPTCARCEDKGRNKRMPPRLVTRLDALWADMLIEAKKPPGRTKSPKKQ